MVIKKNFKLGVCLFFLSQSSSLFSKNCEGPSENWTNCYSKQTLDDGSYYEGNFKDGLRHGKGKVTWTNGDLYMGNWKRGFRHGKGKYIWEEGESYDGEWKEGLQNGQGKSTLTNGDTFIANYIEGKMTGKEFKTPSTKIVSVSH